MPLECICLEVTEGERIADPHHLKRIVDTYKRSALGITLMQGFPFARPQLGVVPRDAWAA